MANGSPVTLAFGLAGVALAPVFGATAIVGAQYGLALGALLDPGPNGDPGRATDSRYGGSTLGSAVPIVWGSYRVSCPIIWIATDGNGSTHVVTRGAGKKGGSGETYLSFAAAVCQGSLVAPDGSSRTRNPVVKKWWGADKVLYSSGDVAASFDLTVHPTGSETFATQGRDSLISTWLGVDQTPTYRGLLYGVFGNVPCAQFGNAIPRIDAEVRTDAVSVADIFSDICFMAGIDSSQFDASDVADVMVTGFAAPSTMSYQDMVTALLLPYGIDMVSHSNKVYLVKRGKAVVATIPAGDLNASRDRQANTPALVVKPAHYVDRFARTDLTYFDSGRNYQATVASSSTVENGLSPNVQRMQTNMVFDSVTGRRKAAFLNDTALVEMEGREISFTLPWSYLDKTPGDCLNIPWLDEADGRLSDTVTKRVRILEIGLATGDGEGVLSVTAVRDEPGVLNQDHITVGSGVAARVPSVGLQPVSVDFYAFSPSKGLFDSDQTTSAGIVVVASTAQQSFAATAYYSLDGGTTWSVGVSVPQRGVWGSLQSSRVPADWSGSPGGTDGSSQADFVPAGSSAIYAASLINGSFNAVSGDFSRFAIADELITAASVTGPSSSKYNLQTLYRGWRNSPATGHVAGQKVVWLGDRSNRPYLFLAMPASAVGNTVKVKVLGYGQTLSDVTAQNVTVSPVPAPVTGPATAPDSVSVAKTWPTASTEQLTFSPVFSTAPTFTQTYEWQTSTSSDNVTWGAWSASSVAAGAFVGPTFGSGYMRARVRAVNSSGSSAWVTSSAVQYSAPPAASSVTFQVDLFSGNSSTTAFTLSQTPSNATPLFVWIENILQRPTTDYSVSGTTLTFTFAPNTGTNNIDVRYGY